MAAKSPKALNIREGGFELLGNFEHLRPCGGVVENEGLLDGIVCLDLGQGDSLLLIGRLHMIGGLRKREQSPIGLETASSTLVARPTNAWTHSFPPGRR
jgi:hypothetical protein